jgi:hypothetical protein
MAMEEKRAKKLMTEIIQILLRNNIHTAALSFADSEGDLIQCKFQNGKGTMETAGKIRPAEPTIIRPH